VHLESAIAGNGATIILRAVGNDQAATRALRVVYSARYVVLIPAVGQSSTLFVGRKLLLIVT
jgi:hypothetical protein